MRVVKDYEQYNHAPSILATVKPSQHSTILMPTKFSVCLVSQHRGCVLNSPVQQRHGIVLLWSASLSGQAKIAWFLR